MTDLYRERWPEVDEATRIARAGSPEAAAELLEQYILKQEDRLSWGLYHATHLLELIQDLLSGQEPTDLGRPSTALFHQLVPEHITKTELERRLRAETGNFLKLYEDTQNLTLPESCEYLLALETTDWGKPFRGNLRAFSEGEFVDFVWLEDGYTKWVDLSLLEANGDTTYILAKVGGRVDTFRDVYHHDEGYAPFRTR